MSSGTWDPSTGTRQISTLQKCLPEEPQRARAEYSGLSCPLGVPFGKLVHTIGQLTKVASWQAGKNVPAFQEPESWSSPGKLVQYQLVGSSPGELVQYQLFGSSPGELLAYSSPGKLVQYQLVRRAPGKLVLHQLTRRAPGKLVLHQLAGSSPGKLVQYQLIGGASWQAGTIPAGQDSQAPNKLALYQLAGRDLAMVLNLHWHTRRYLPQVTGYPSEMATAVAGTGAGVANAWFL
ncbi:hypothetical protein PCASD_10856 [Puccinia coronata f. sp. avenae]|uniref:Uncharacterized protein n=1 Tax=Puccinia coronata f. sp. avenae TaxID=200324 RepID=A0A2N5UUG0_9BASI|nr:hypothetical protein PCASD_10856 [Puccinia coronata f. sp. avenae]